MFSIVEKEWLQEGKKQAWKNTKAEAIRWVVNINNKLDTWISVGVTHISAPHQPKIFFFKWGYFKVLDSPSRARSKAAFQCHLHVPTHLFFFHLITTTKCDQWCHPLHFQIAAIMCPIFYINSLQLDDEVTYVECDDKFCHLPWLSFSSAQESNHKVQLYLFCRQNTLYIQAKYCAKLSQPMDSQARPLYSPFTCVWHTEQLLHASTKLMCAKAQSSHGQTPAASGMNTEKRNTSPHSFKVHRS